MNTKKTNYFSQASLNTKGIFVLMLLIFGSYFNPSSYAQLSVQKTIDCPSIGKDIVFFDNEPGKVEIRYEIEVCNTGTETIENVTLQDNLSGNLGQAFEGARTPTPTDLIKPTSQAGSVDPTINGSFDGKAAIDFITGTNTLVSNDCFTVQLYATINLCELTSDVNTVIVAADGVSSESADHTIPNIFQISSTKELVSSSVNPMNGFYQFTFDITAMNTGNGTITSLSITDDLSSVFADMMNVSVISITVLGPNSNNLEANTPVYDGNANTDLITETSGEDISMAPGDTETVRLVIEVDPMATEFNIPENPIFNQAEINVTNGPLLFSILTGGQPFSHEDSENITLGDLDGDGDLDAFVVNEYEENSIWRNDGNGLFEEITGQSFGVDISREVSLGDLDGDGDLDAFEAIIGFNKVWLNNGNGVFIEKPGQPFPDRISLGVALGDLDGDGHLDAFVANDDVEDTVWKNDGNGVFTEVVGQSFLVAESLGLSLGDLDGDGHLDAFVASSAENTIWKNDGSGVFTQIGLQPFLDELSWKVELGDLDGDGDLDAFVVNLLDENTVWSNNGSGVFTEIVGQSFQESRSKGISLGDLDGDGDLDAFVANEEEQNTVWSNDGNGVFTEIMPSQPFSNEDEESLAVALGDLDGDGDLDAFVANDGEANTVWSNDGNGIFTEIMGQPFGTDESEGVALGDLDGDGDLDAFVANDGSENRVWSNDGDGVFTEIMGQSFGTDDSQGVALGDLDGDGDLDAFVANEKENRVWSNDGNGVFAEILGQSFGPNDSYDVSLGDLDGDGDLDAFVANEDGVNRVWSNDGNGVFAEILGQTFGPDESYGVSLGDLDCDGDLDAFVANDNGVNRIWSNDGNGVFAEILGQSFGPNDSYDVSLGDLDGDGDLDAFVANEDGVNRVWSNDGTGVFTEIVGHQFSENEESFGVSLGDLDGDGDLDAFVANEDKNTVWSNNGGGATAIDVSDHGDSPKTTNPGFAGDTGTTDDPTAFYAPGDLTLIKSLSYCDPITGDVMASPTAGNVYATYFFTILNTGAQQICHINLLDDMIAEFGAGFVKVISQPAYVGAALAGRPTENHLYLTTPDFDTNLLKGDGCLDPGMEATYEVTVELDLSQLPIDPENQATVNGENQNDDSIISDLSDDFNMTTPIDGFDDPTPLPLDIIPLISVSKTVSKPPTVLANNNYEVEFTFTVTNEGQETLTGLNLQDELSIFNALVPGSIKIDVLTLPTSGSLVANINYDGDPMTAANQELFGMNVATLASGSSFSATLSMELDAATLSAMTMPIENKCTASATGNISTKETQFESNTVTLTLPAGLQVDKQVDGTSAIVDAPGKFEVDYTITISNFGGQTITDFNLVDDLVTNLGDGFVEVSSYDLGMSMLSLGSVVPTINPAFDGGYTDAKVFDETMTNALVVGDVVVVEMTVVVDADKLDPNQSTNIAVANPFDSASGSIYGAGSAMLPPLYQISATKAMTNSKVNDDGDYEFTFLIKVQNTGTAALENLRLKDDLTVFDPLIIDTEIDIVKQPLTPIGLVANNLNYDGLIDTDLITTASGDGTPLVPGDFYEVQLKILLGAGITLPSRNQADASASDVSGMISVDDASDDGTGLVNNGDPLSSNPMAFGDMGTDNDVTPIGPPAILELIKEVSTVEPATTPGNAIVTWKLTVVNKGEVGVSNMSLIEDMQAHFGDGFIGLVDPAPFADNTNLDVNPAFTGIAPNDDLLLPNQSLPPLVVENIFFSAEIDLDKKPNPAFNQAVVSGKSPEGFDVSDLSDDMIPANPDTDDDPTPFPKVPLIGVSKNLNSSSVLPDGNASFVFEFKVQNTGTDILTDLRLFDKLSATLSNLAESTNVTIGSQPSSGTLLANIMYTGDGILIDDVENRLITDLSGQTATLEPGDIYSVFLELIIDPSSLVEMDLPFMNQATAEAEGEKINVVATDLSDDGLNPFTNNDFNLFDDPTVFELPLDCSGLACYESVNLSLDQMCSGKVTPATVLPEVLNPAWYYVIEVFDYYTNLPVENMFDVDDIGKKFKVRISLPGCDGLTCWSELNIEDYLPPFIDCEPDIEVECYQMDMVVHPTIVNNYCDDVDLILVDSMVNLLDCEPYTAEILKTWTAYDKAGNQGNTCIQRILVKRPNIYATMPPPVTFEVECNQFVVDDQGNPHPTETGIPELNNNPVWPNVPESLCETSVSYKDYPVIDGTCKRIIRRVWDIYEWHCFGEEHVQFVQMITISDKTAPHLEVPDDFTVAAGPDCGNNIYIPFAYAHDDCAGLKYIHLNSDLDYAADGGKTGAYLDLEIGDNIVEYIAIDSCHNEVTKTITVTVLDLREPVAICDAHPVISLTAGGTAILTAEKIDGGSFDECGPVWLAIAKMNETCEPADTVFGPFVNLCCEDVGTINVILRVTDLHDNVSMCMMPIQIDDLYLPEILEPNDTTVTCTTPYDLNNLGIQFGEAQQITGCLDTLIERVEENISDCGEGNITRTFVAYNSKGDSSTAKQVIYFENNDKFDGDTDIDWLADTTLYLSPMNDLCLIGKDTSNTESFVLPTSKDSLGITKDNCDLIGVTFKDSLFRANAKLNACYFIKRHWKVLDWCQKPNGEYKTWDSIQIITVLDTIRPVIDTSYIKGAEEPTTTPGVDTVFIKACDPQVIQSKAVGTTNCDTILYWSWELLDAYGAILDQSAMPFEVSVSDTATADLNIIDEGQYTIVWTAHDGCGNFDEMMNTFVLKNKKVAVPYAKSIAVQIQPVNNFPDSFSVSVHIDQLDNGSYHECQGVDINLSFSPDPNDDIRVYDCSQAGTVVIDTLYVTDDLGNQNYVTTNITVGVDAPVILLSHPHMVDASMNVAIDIDDAVVSVDTVCMDLMNIGFGPGYAQSLAVDCANGNGAASTYIYFQDAYNPVDSIKFDYQIIGCTTTSPRISGEIVSINEEPMEDIMVHLVGSESAPDFTDSEGTFAFPNMPLGGSYGVEPTHDHDPLNGVSTLDLVMIQRHVLGVTNLTDPYQLIAADVNNNEDVSAIDLIELRKLILGIYTDFPSNASWRFLDADYVFPNPNDPWLQALPEGYSINTLLTDMHIPFVGVKTGDVNGSAIMNYNGSNVSSRSQAKKVTLEQIDAKTIDVSFEEEEAISGWQLAFNLDQTIIDKVNVLAGDFDVQSHNWHKHPDKGVMTFSWHSMAASDLDQKVMFQLYVESGIDVSDVTMNESMINAEAYTDVLERKPLTLESRSTILEETTLSIYPNPWIHEARVEYSVNVGQVVELIITDASGRVIAQENIDAQSGINRHSITEDQLPDSGVYFVKLVSNEGQKDLRMIKIE